MAGADAQLQHHRRIRRLGKLEPSFHHLHDALEIRTRVEEPHLGFHGKGVRALLHDRGALAVVLADDDERAAGHPARRHVRERIARHVRTHGRFPGDGAADGVVHGSRQHGRGGGLRGARLEPRAQVLEHVLGVRQHVHQVRDRRALIAAHVAHAGLQQCLGDGEDRLAVKFLALAETQLADFLSKRALSHRDLPATCSIPPPP